MPSQSHFGTGSWAAPYAGATHRFTNAGLADEYRVVLLATRQDLPAAVSSLGREL